ncbi:MAG: glycoside hydrolase, partial [Burkholderiales bacterium]|nr:glycoside hydrolase [Opitutaceae bacterium]
GGQVDGRWLGIHDQNGNDRFTQRFALRAHGGYEPVAAMRFALEHQNPLVAGQVIADGPAAPYSETHYSFASVDNPSVLLWALKPAEEGLDHGVIARLWNVSDAPATASIRLTSGTASAQRTTHIETNLEPVALAPDSSLPSSFARQQIQTYRLVPKTKE